jgi:hypothetical protein
VTIALPILVKSLFAREELRSACVKALVLFGNLALEPIEKELQCDDSVSSIDVLLEPLAAINTGASALAIARLYPRFADEPSSRKISLILATMLDQPLIESEIRELSESELPAWLVSGVRSEQWYSGPTNSVPSQCDLLLDSGVRNVQAGVP